MFLATLKDRRPQLYVMNDSVTIYIVNKRKEKKVRLF